MSNDTPNTPGLSETKLREMKVDDLREKAKKEGVADTADMKKEELVDAISAAYRNGGGTSSGSDSTSGNDTPNTPGLSETKLREMKIDDLRTKARKEGIQGADDLKKEDLVRAFSEAYRNGDGGAGNEAGGEVGSDVGKETGGDEAGLPGDVGPDGGRLRTGEQTSKSLKYVQEITSLDDDPERKGRSLATTSHEVIRRWAEDRKGLPATVEGTEHGDLLGVLRFDFGGDTERLRRVTWDEWFQTFDARKLNFIYQEERKDGHQSTFFRLESPEREDA